MPLNRATESTPALRHPTRPTRTSSTGVAPLSSEAKHSGWSTSNSYVLRWCCSAPRPVKPSTVDWLWVPLRQVQLARPRSARQRAAGIEQGLDVHAVVDGSVGDGHWCLLGFGSIAAVAAPQSR